MIRLQPVSDNLLIKITLEDSSKTSSGIIIPKAVTEKPDRGIVVSVGQGRMLNNGTRIEPIVKVGNEILFSKFAGTELNIEGETYLMIKENDITAIILEE